MSESSNTQFQENENIFRKIINEGVIYDKDKLKEFLKTQVEKDAKLMLLQSVKSLAKYSPILIFSILILMRVLSELMSDNSNKVEFMVYFSACILGMISVIIILLIHTSSLEQKESINILSNVEKHINELVFFNLNSQCKFCAQVKTKNDLNAYNLYTYEQILQIEQSLSGVEAAVYCYSRYRDDGGIGPLEADKIVDYNLSKGIKYYYIYYENPPGATEPVQRDGEKFVDLSKEMKPEGAYKECLDYQIYKEARFDVMIYQWDNLHIEGYFCLNFPIGNCKNCDRTEAEHCPLKSTNGTTDKLLYKKMPQDITEKLYEVLFDLANIKKG